jgi:tetratricopeptide (TPR) repeat protein
MNEPAIAFRPRVVTASDSAIVSPIGESALLAAEQAYRRILTVQPAHFRTLGSLAMVRLQLGDPKEAHALLSQAAETADLSADAHLQLGKSFSGLGDLDRAVAQYKLALERDARCIEARLLFGKTLCSLGDFAGAASQFEDAIATDATNADAHQGLGLALQRLGQFEQAISHHEAALSFRPQLPDAHASLGDACRQLGRHEEAIAHYKQALAIHPRALDILLNLGGCYHAAAQRDAAISTFQQILITSPHLAEAHYNLGNLYLELDNWHAALFHYERAIAERPGFSEAHNNLANALQARGRYQDAITHYREAIRLNPRFSAAHRNLGNALRAAKQFDGAVASYRAALAIDPQDVVALNHLAGALMVTGQLDEATRAFDSALQIEPDNVGIQLNYATVKRFTSGDPRLSRLQTAAANEEKLPENQRIALHFALGKAYADIRDGERSFQHLQTANRLERRRMPYDEHQTLQHMERIRSVFTSDLFAARANAGDRSNAPVFVVGMPRSGTSLVEQILASHPRVYGAGEVNYLSNTIAQSAGRAQSEYPEALAKMSAEELRELGTAYLASFTGQAAAADRIVDKMPSNFLFVGLIRLALPNAKIIHVKRNPIDTCLSCYSLWFAEAQPFAYDLGELGRYYKAYDALMDHWRSVLPEGTMLEVQYEDVVHDLERHARTIVAHCGLEWDRRCLAFHETKRPVDTASVVQVRQPLFRNSIGRWRLYGAQLNPLFDALGTDAVRSAVAAVIAPVHPGSEPAHAATAAVAIDRSTPLDAATEQSTTNAQIGRAFAVAKKLQTRGDHDDAASLFDLILVSAPEHFGALIGLGVIATHAGRFDEAKRHFRRAIAIVPNSPEAHGSLGAVHASVGELDAAVDCYLKALSLAPDHPGILYAYATLLQSQGRNDDAMAMLRRAIENKPLHPDAHFALGNLFYAVGNDIEAAKCYLKVLEFNPDHAETHNNIGNVLLRQGYHERGMEHYNRAIASKPEYADAYGNLGNALLELNRLEESIEQNLRALKIKPHRFGSFNNLGVAYQALGRFEEATQAFTRAIELSPDEAPIHLNLANMEKFKADDRRLPGLKSLLNHVDELDNEKQIAAHFAMGKALADLKDYDQAFQHLQKGNVLKRASFAYDEVQRLATMANIGDKFTPELIRALSGHGDPSWSPIFIVGMPRSGTTLMEQVLASHSRVFGAGELETFKELIGECAKSQRVPPAYPDLITSLPPERITELGQLYTAHVRALAPDAAHIVDKMPLNFLFVGLIHLALPKAKIVHIRRDPMDNCVSCYQLLFTGSQPFAYDLAELGHYYRGYERVMAHWRKVLPPGVMIDVKYEELVDDLEGVSRGVLAHCGLDWEDACRDFQATERAVRTASLMQVREPLYRTSVGSWRRYEKFLGPLREALGNDAQAAPS